MTGSTGVGSEDLSEDALQVRQSGILDTHTANALLTNACRDVWREVLVRQIQTNRNASPVQKDKGVLFQAADT